LTTTAARRKTARPFLLNISRQITSATSFNIKFMKLAVFYIALFAFAITASGQAAFAQNAKGKISGKIIDKRNGEGLIGATVQVEGTTTGAAADLEGQFLLALDPGNYTLVYTYISYKTAKMEITVKPGEVTFANMTMEENKTELREVVITNTAVKSTDLAVLTERKNAAQVSDGVSAELIRKTPDRTTSDVLKRVTGASIQEGKFAVIRGMNDRYNAGYLDGALLPSTEADRKAFAFDAVPANLIDNLQIVKAGTPEMLGDFGGGVIKITTKLVPEKLTQTFSIAGQMNSITTFKDFSEFKKYGGESFNILSDQRNLPAFADNALKSTTSFPSAEEARRFADIASKFNNDWSNSNIKAPINTRLAYSLGFPIRISDTKKVGILMALNYANTRKISQGEVNSYDGGGQVAAFKDNMYQQNITDGGIFNVNYLSNSTKINFRNLLNINTDFNTTQRSGPASVSDNVTVRNVANMVSYNRLFNSILSVKQIVGKEMLLHASVNYANVHRKIPDYRIASYSVTPDDDNYKMALGDFFNSSTGRFTSDLKEQLYGTNLKLTKQFADPAKTDVRVGLFMQNRKRDFSSRSFVYGGNPPGDLSYNPATDLSSQHVGPSKLYLVEKTSDDIAYYNGKSTVAAGFVELDQKFFDKLRVVYGVRYEHADIRVTNDKTSQDFAHINEGNFLPSANLTYSLTERTNLRASYFSSVNRPEFRELAPFSFYVFDKNAEIRGNKDLQVANLRNYDLRFEFFPSGSQIISAGAFYKSILNPVEFSIDITQPFTTFTYQNEKGASVYGLEFEFRKNFDFLGEAKFLKDLVAYSNLAIIKSKLDFVPGSQDIKGRPLQGQSPYVVNAGIQYENTESGWFASAVLNRVGRRIAFVGVDPKFGDTRQDIYEGPRTVIDLQVGKNIGHFNLKLTVGDLLHSSQVFYQDANHNGSYDPTAKVDRLMYRYTYGMTTTLSVGYTF
jgi:outer membrane receptor protein involved in Fe transport